MSDDRRSRTEDAETTAMQIPDEATARLFARSDAGPGQGRSSSGSVADPSWPAESSSRTSTPRVTPRPVAAPGRPARRRARLTVSRVDPWSVFVLALLVSIFLGVVLLVAVSVLYALLDALGILSSVDGLAQELDLVEPGQPLLGLGRVLTFTAVLAALDAVLLTVLATLSAFLYNLCASLTGGIEVTLAERE